MKKQLYIFSDSILKRKQNTLVCERIINDDSNPEDEYEKEQIEEYYLGDDIIIPNGEEKIIPVEGVNSIFSFGMINFNSKFLYFLSQNKIPLHIYNYFGGYSGSFIPEASFISGSMIIKQSQFYSNERERLKIAKEFVTAAAQNALANLKYYKSRGKHLSDFIEHIADLTDSINSAHYVDELMGIEGLIKKTYYGSWKYIFNYPVDFTNRVKRPPNNLVNTLISFGNAIVYSVCVNELYQTRLYPEIGYLHEPSEGRLSLSLDLAEIFKPIIVDRTIFKCINKNIISEDDGFFKKGAFILKKEAKQKFVQVLDEKLNDKIHLDTLDKNVSYKRLIREECYKLQKHFNNEEDYKSYISKW